VPDATLKLSVVIPAHNEAEGIASTLRAIAARLRAADVPFEFVVVDDHSTDGTGEVLERLRGEIPELRRVENPRSGGFGHAVIAGLEAFSGDAVAIVMADASDDPADLVAYYRTLLQGYDCVFGSRFVSGATVVDYPRHKLLLNRLTNWFIRLLFGLRLNDTTNAFKCYRREVIAGCQPLLSKHFNLTVELPLKAIVRGYSYAVVPINWYNRTTGVSKLKIKEMGSRYLFIVLYVWLERVLSRGDYRRPTAPSPSHPRGES
jgi:dolichol-phosphate mannosyltransferase